MCLSVLGEMMEKWGSLRLVSQEGMEAWQKKLNEILVDVERVRDSLERAGRTFYAALLDAHREYFRDVGSELNADDLDEKEKRRQTRRIRRVAYAKPRSYKIFGVCHQRRRRRGRRR